MSTDKTYFEDVDAAATIHSRSPPPRAPPPHPPRNIVTVFTHHRPRKASSSTNSSHSHHLNNTGDNYGYSTGIWSSSSNSSRHAPRSTGTTSAGAYRPSTSDHSRSSHESPPLTSSSASGGFSNATQRRDRTPPSYTPPSSSNSPTSPVSASHHHHHRHGARAAASTSTSISTSTSSKHQQQSKAKYKMPFRDRMARRFGETVSAPDSLDSVSFFLFFSLLRCRVRCRALHRPPPSPLLITLAPIRLSRRVRHQIIEPTPSFVIPGLAPAGVASGRSRPRPHSACHAHSNIGARRVDSGGESVGCGGFGRSTPWCRRGQEPVRRRGPKTRDATTGRPLVLEIELRTPAAARNTPADWRSGRAAQAHADHDHDELDDLLRSRPWEDRMTGACSEETKADQDGKQLSPTSPYLSCEYPPAAACDEIVHCANVTHYRPRCLPYATTSKQHRPPVSHRLLTYSSYIRGYQGAQE